MNDESECTGADKCHGCLNWCSTCGDVGHVCDMRLRGERCDSHPVPPHWGSLRTSRSQAERTIHAGKGLIREGESALAAPSANQYACYHDGDVCFTRDEAIAGLNKRIAARRKSIEKQLAKLDRLAAAPKFTTETKVWPERKRT